MSQLSVVVTDHVEPDLMWEGDQLAGMDVRLEVHQQRHAAAAELLDRVREADVLIVNMARIDADVIGGLQRCRLIIRHGAGYENVDIDAAAARGISVASIPDYCTEEVAEQAWTLILASQRHLLTQRAALDASAGSTDWDFSAMPPTYRLHGKTLGIIGYGRIGQVVARNAQGFGMRILAHSPSVSPGTAPHAGVEGASLTQILDEADVITLHVPLNAGTRKLIGAEELAAMQSTAVLVNTSRGPVVDLAALDKALNNGEIAAAGIDVYEQEPPATDLAILDNPRALCTPHLAWLSEEASWRIRELIIEEVRRHLDGFGPRMPVVARNRQ